MQRGKTMSFIVHYKKSTLLHSIFLIFILILMVLISSSCTKQEDNTLVIAKQYGIAYAPLQIMQEKNFLDAHLEDTVNVEWVQLGNTTAIREAMLADGLDVGFMGIPPFLIGLDQGMEWKMMSGLSESPLGLITNDPSIKSLEDLVDAGKIALPQPGSIQHILLSMEAGKKLGQSNIFDHQLISMNHPDGYQALLVDDTVVAHYTAPPYLFKELKEQDAHLLASSGEGMGEPFTFIVGVCRESFYEDTKQYDAFQRALEDSINFLYDSPEEALDILSQAYEIDRETLRSYLYDEQMVYTTNIKGVTRFIEFMYAQEYLNKQWEVKEVIWKEK